MGFSVPASNHFLCPKVSMLRCAAVALFSFPRLISHEFTGGIHKRFKLLGWVRLVTWLYFLI